MFQSLKRSVIGPEPQAGARRAAAMPAFGNQARLRRLDQSAAQKPLAPPVVDQVLRGPGRALDAATSSFFEARFGTSLAAVRLHDGAQAAQSARAVGALAYAAGPHVVLGDLPSSGTRAWRLLAHELAHVVQSGAAEPGILRRQTPEDEITKDPPAAIPLPGGNKFDIAPFLPLPGGKAPTPFDKPGTVTDPSGKGPSLQNLSDGGHMLFDKKQPNVSLNKNYQLPSCFILESPGSTPAARKYKTFEQYDTERKVFHGPLSKEAWPPLSPGQYAEAIAKCPQSEAPLPKLPREPAPMQDAPPALPPGQAYA